METSWIKNIIENIKITFNSKKVNSPSLKVKNKAKKIEQYVNIGLTYSEAKDLTIAIVNQELTKFKDEAELIFKKRAKKFSNDILFKIKDFSKEELSKLKDPDTQFSLIEAVKIGGRKENEELRTLLSNLVVNRIKGNQTEKEDLKNIVYNEAISTINKLTIDQLRIITLCFLLRYTSHNKIASWQTFNEYLNSHIKPFLDFNNTNTEFQHIQYAGCGNIDLGSWDFVKAYQQQYSFLFLNLVEKNKINELELPQEIRNEIIALNKEEDKYFIRFKNKNEFEKYLKEKNIDEKIIKKLILIYDGSVKNINEVQNKITDETDIGKKLINLWGDSNLKHLSLTSVGIVIGANYFEQIVGEKINIDIWIN